jgi:hypothetical protein
MFFSRLVRALKRRFFPSKLTNSPFLSGDSFANLSDYEVYGKFKSDPIDLERLKAANTIFVPGDRYREFISEYGSFVRAKVILIGNSDENFDTLPFAPNGVNLVLCQNLGVAINDKFKTLPIGLENRRLARAGNPKLYKKSEPQKKALKVYVPPMSPTNPIRPRVLAELEGMKSDIFVVDRDYLEIRKYIRRVGNFQFLLCLEGNGHENHRVWESLYLNIFPVMFATPWSESLKYLNLPILYINTLSELNEQLLSDFYSKHSSFKAVERAELWIPFWENLINTNI